jgi:hypothetical protein
VYLGSSHIIAVTFRRKKKEPVITESMQRVGEGRRRKVQICISGSRTERLDMGHVTEINWGIGDRTLNRLQ